MNNENLSGAAGHKKPPEMDQRDPKGRFRAGRRLGRPMGAKNKISREVEAILAADAPAIARKITTKAKGGNMAAAIAVLRTLVPAARERPASVTIETRRIDTIEDAGEVVSDLIAAVCEGTLDPDSAHKVASVIATRVRVLEATQIEERLAAIERQLGKSS